MDYMRMMPLHLRNALFVGGGCGGRRRMNTRRRRIRIGWMRMRIRIGRTCDHREHTDHDEDEEE